MQIEKARIGTHIETAADSSEKSKNQSLYPVRLNGIWSVTLNVNETTATT